MNKSLIGPAILIFVAGVIGFLMFGQEDGLLQPKTTIIKGYVGGEKKLLLENLKIQKLLKKKYAIEVSPHKSGSIEMVRTAPIDQKDFLWPSNQVAVEFYQSRGAPTKGHEIIFNSPIVIYTWKDICDKLIENDIVVQKDGIHYLNNFSKLLTMIEERKNWSDIGLEQLYGKIKILSTDPVFSNSGNMFYALISILFNQGEVPTQKDLNVILPKLKDLYAKMGFMERSSGDIFENFLKMGIGARPMIVGYENQMVEFSLANEDIKTLLNEKVRVLYPIPTVWSSHPMIALNENGQKLIQALKDPEIQEIAWKEHGFRAGVMGIKNDPSLLNLQGIPKQITSVVPMPNMKVMESILDTLEKP